MRFDGWNTIEGRHLVFAYVSVALIQLGYLGWVVRQWVGVGRKTAKPL